MRRRILGLQRSKRLARAGGNARDVVLWFLRRSNSQEMERAWLSESPISVTGTSGPAKNSGTEVDQWNARAKLK